MHPQDVVSLPLLELGQTPGPWMGFLDPILTELPLCVKDKLRVLWGENKIEIQGASR